MPQTVIDIVNARRIIDGPADNLRAISAQRYPWVQPLWEQMLANNWVAQQVPLLRDKKQFRDLSKGSQFGFRAALAFLSNLDAIQVDNLTENISRIITDPGVSKLISRQSFEEAMHNEAYSIIAEELFPGEVLDIYDMARSVPMLADKNKMILAQARQVTLEPTPQNKIKALVSNLILEGVYFFSGFLTFYSIARSTGKMLESKDMIRYIQRDELTHLDIFANAYLACKQERPELFTKELAEECQELFRKGVELETTWGHYVIQHGVPGLSEDGVALFLQERGERVARKIGLGGIWTKTMQPYDWFEDYASVDAMNKTAVNFFEGKNGRYSETIPQFTPGRSYALA
jgi:ribonucleoside-diphosphate reductase beta chain